jgi:hypothetical protein
MATRATGTHPARTHAAFAAVLVWTTACGVEPDTGASSAAVEVVWEDDPFDPLALGPLDGQNGWASLPERGSAEVVAYAGGKRLKIAATDEGPVIIMGKSITPHSTGRHVLELDVEIENPALASLAKLEVDTYPRPGETGKWANKKFQVYFGSSIRITYGAEPVELILVPNTQANSLYRLRFDIDLVQERVSAWVGADRRGSSLPMGAGPLVGLGLSGWDRTDEVTGPVGPVYLDNLRGSFYDHPGGRRVWCVQVERVRTGYPCSNPFALPSVQAAVDLAGPGDEIRLANQRFGPLPGAPAVAIVDTELTFSGGYAGGPIGWAVPSAGPDESWIASNTGGDGIRILGPVTVTLRNLSLAGGGVQALEGVVRIDEPVHLIYGGESKARLVVSSELRILRGHAHTFLDGTTIEGPGQVAVRGGTLVSPGSITVERLELHVGTIVGPGRVRVTSGFDIVGHSLQSLDRVTVINQGVTTSTADAPIHVKESLFVNQGVFEIRGNGSFAPYGGGQPTFQNDGIVRRSAATGTAIIGVGFTGGRVEVQTGTLRLVGDYISTGSLDAVVARGATLLLTGGSGHAYQGTLTGTGAGTIAVEGNIRVGAAGWTLDVPGDMLQWSAGTLSTDGGELVNRGELHIVGNSTRSIDNVTIRNPGTIVWTGASTIYAQRGTLLDIQPGGVLEIRGDGSFERYGSGSSAVTNAGTIRRTASTGTASFQYLPVTNTGTIAIESGYLRIRLGSYTQAATGTLAIDIAGGAPGTGYGVLQVVGPMSLAGTLDLDLVGGFAPAPGQTFQVMTFSGRVGVVVIDTGGVPHVATYNPGDLTITFP